jgi:hypothetical protein
LTSIRPSSSLGDATAQGVAGIVIAGGGLLETDLLGLADSLAAGDEELPTLCLLESPNADLRNALTSEWIRVVDVDDQYRSAERSLKYFSRYVCIGRENREWILSAFSERHGLTPGHELLLAARWLGFVRAELPAVLDIGKRTVRERCDEIRDRLGFKRFEDVLTSLGTFGIALMCQRTEG